MFSTYFGYTDKTFVFIHENLMILSKFIMDNSNTRVSPFHRGQDWIRRIL